MACNFPVHPLPLVHTVSADPMEMCLFLQPLQSGIHSHLKITWSLWLMICMAGVSRGTLLSFLFSLSSELLLPDKSMSPAQDWKSEAVSTSSLLPFLGERKLLFPCVFSHPFFHPFRRHFWRQGDHLQTRVAMIQNKALEKSGAESDLDKREEPLTSSQAFHSTAFIISAVLFWTWQHPVSNFNTTSH